MTEEITPSTGQTAQEAAQTEAVEFQEVAASAKPEQNTARNYIPRVGGKDLNEMPCDLYIPPGALEVYLEAFEGPLDLLLYLIKKQNLDILDIPIATITCQYMEYVEVMKEMELELAAEYLLMSALLAEIKSRFLLPRPESDDENEEGDPRAELIRRLQEYEQMKKAAEALDQLPRAERDVFGAQIAPPEMTIERPQPEVSLQSLLNSLNDAWQRSENMAHHHIAREVLSVRETMTKLVSSLPKGKAVDLTWCLINTDVSRAGVVVTFIALLELLKQSVIELQQDKPYAPIQIKVK